MVPAVLPGSGEPASAAYRLWVSFPDKENPTLREHLERLLHSPAERRAFACAALEKGDETAIRRAGLSDAETQWLLMWCRHNAGDAVDALACMAEVPADGYPDKIGVIAASWSLVVGDDELAALAGLHVGSCASDAALLVRIGLGDAVVRKPGAPDQLPGATVSASASSAVAEVANLLSHGSGVRVAGRAGVLCAVVRALIDHRWPDEIVPAGEHLVTLSDEVLDDLIDAGIAPPELAEAIPAGDATRQAYLRARMSPELLTNEELRSLPHTAELARRRFLAGEDVASLGDEQARVFALLDRLRRGDLRALSDLVPLLPSEHRATAVAVGASLRDGRIHPEVLDDVSTWPVLAPLVATAEPSAIASTNVQRLRAWSALDQGQKSLYEWNYEAAIQHARECLRISSEEGLRDEALSLLACALLQQGNAEAASRALEEAIQGLDSPELLINYGIAAADHDRTAATKELARLASEAPTLELRVTAAERALLLWHTQVPGLVDDADLPPDVLIEAMRSLSVEPTLPDEHVDIMRFLSSADDEWLADPKHTAASPHAHTLAHRYLIARAQGPKEGVAELARLMREHPDDAWLRGERESLVEGLISYLLEHHGDALGVAMWALEAHEAGLALDDRQQILLPTLGVRELAFYMAEEKSGDGVPRREIFEKLRHARTVLQRTKEVDAALYGELIDSAVGAFAVACWNGWISEYNAIVDAYNSALAQLSGIPRRRVNSKAVQQATMPMLAALDESALYVDAIRVELKDEELLSELEGFRKKVAGLREAVASLAS